MPETLVFDDSISYRTIRMEGFNEALGEIGFGEKSKSEWRFFLDLTARHANVGGVCHGGVLLSLADIGMGAAAYQVKGRLPAATIEMSTYFVAAARPGNRVHGCSRLVRAVKNLVFMEAEMWSQDRLVVTASGIWKVLDRSAARPPDGSGTPG